MNVRNERLETPLMLCCRSVSGAEEKQKVLNYLLGKKAKVNLQDIDGQTALIHASLSNSGEQIIRALLDAKASPWVQDERNNTVFDYVINAGDLETTRLLINACRDNMLADDREIDRVEHLEEYLASIQDMRKVSWPLMGPRAQRSQMHGYAAKKEESSLSLTYRMGCELGVKCKSPQLERRRKRSVCHFGPLDIQEILNSDEGTRETKTNPDKETNGNKSEPRKTSVRSLSEEERFSVQISDGENTAIETLPELEKLLTLQDSFSSSLDSIDSHSTANDPVDFGRFAHEQVYQKATSEATEVEMAKRGNKTCASFADYESKKKLDTDCEKDEVKSEKKSTQSERLFKPRASPDKYVTGLKSDLTKTQKEGTTSVYKESTKADLDKTGEEISQHTSHGTHRQSSPVPRITGRQTTAARTLNQRSIPRVSPVTILSEQNRRDGSIVRRYTLSSMDMGKLHSLGVANSTMVPQRRSTPGEPAAFEFSTKGGPEGGFTPPELRKSKSDLTDWISMSEYFQETEMIEFTIKNSQNDHQNAAQAKFDGDEIGEVQLPSISSSKIGRRSPKEKIYERPTVISPSKSRQTYVEEREELAGFLSKSNIGNDKQSRSQSRIKLSTDPSNSSSITNVSSEKSHTPTQTTTGNRDETSEEALPDLLLSCLPHESSLPSHGRGSPPNLSSTTFKDTTTPEKSTPSSSHGQQRLSPRLRPGTLLPPLLITNRRTPTHEMEDGYFSGTPSPADVESPRKKHSNEHLRYSFKPISPRSPIPSQKVFPLQSGKAPSSR